MKKFSYIYIFLGLIFCSLLSSARGWNNNPSFGYSKSGMTKDQWGDHFTDYHYYNRDYDYSSHDWIAEEALSLSLASPYGSLWNDFWSEKRKNIYLYATMGPDSRSIEFKTQSGRVYHGNGDKLNHHYYYDDQTRLATDTHLSVSANEMATEAMSYIAKGDCDTAAFFLGQMAGYMGDAGCFPNIYQNADSIHGNYETYMSTRMDSCWGQAKVSSANPYNSGYMYECFKTWILPIQVHPFFSVEESTAILAYNTRFNPNVNGIPGIYTAKWLTEKWPSIRKPSNPIQLVRYDYMRDKWQGYAGYDPVSFNYWNRIEQQINDAVLYVADALTWVITEVGSYTCKQGLNDVQQSITKYLSLGTAFMLFSYLGMYLVEYFLRTALIITIKPM